jgi:hypothetical protein
MRGRGEEGGGEYEEGMSRSFGELGGGIKRDGGSEGRGEDGGVSEKYVDMRGWGRVVRVG